MTIIKTLDKIGKSPSRSAAAWIGAFVIGIGAATCVFPIAGFTAAGPSTAAFLILASVSGIIIKNKVARLSVLAGFLFAAGFCRYLSAGAGSFDALRFFPALVSAKSWLLASVGRLLPEPEAGYLAGLLVGGGTRSEELKAAFVATGTAHVMALSGWNITVINRWLDRILSALHFGRNTRWAFGTAAVAAFVVMTGASASLVRAAVMSVIATIALSCGRRSAPGRAVFFAASAMLFVSPRLLREDVGFLLSLAATLGLIYLAPLLEPLSSCLPKRFGIAKTFAETVSATLATLPISLASFGQVSLIAIPANLLLLPFIPVTMGAGLVAAVVAGVFQPLAGAAGKAVGIIVGYDISVIRLLSRVPGASISGFAFGPSAAVLMSSAIAFVAAKSHAHSR